MENTHSMVTRSKKDKLKPKIKNNNGDKDDIDEIDEHGNLSNFIDYECNEPIDDNMLNNEILRLRNPNRSLITDLLVSSIFLDYQNKNKRRNKKKKKTKTNDKNESKVDISNSKKDITDNKSNENIDIDNSNKIESDSNILVINNEQLDDISSEGSIDEDYLIDEVNISENSELESDYDTDSSYDEYDDEYEDILDESLNIYEDDDLEYFHKLDNSKKENYIKQLKDINNINESNVPLKFKILNSNLDLQTKSVAISNINKYSNMESSNGEFIKMEQWIKGLINIPIGKYKELPINNNTDPVSKARYFKNIKQTLDKSIYGHDEAKYFILQTIGKWIKDPVSSGNVLALQGPMGNGKTTLVKEGIAKALDRPFEFIALGGASDSSFFDGHNFTYEGSKWGRIIDILMKCKYMNPIIYFDELDKVSETYKGEEIIHLLTHLTDPSQNTCFHDNYFSGIDFDLSKALFIFSFNDESKINRILKDRMTVINTKGFKVDDKVKISNEYLLPELLKTYKYTDKLIFTDTIIKQIIENYTNNEEGVRNLKRCFDSIISKINIYEILYNESSESSINLPYSFDNFTLPYTITEKDINNILNKNEIDKPPEHMYM